MEGLTKRAQTGVSGIRTRFLKHHKENTGEEGCGHVREDLQTGREYETGLRNQRAQ